MVIYAADFVSKNCETKPQERKRKELITAFVHRYMFQTLIDVDLLESVQVFFRVGFTETSLCCLESLHCDI